MRLRQPARGYRVAIDPVLLAAAVPAKAGERVLDLGSGTGAAALCLAHRAPAVHVTGLELQAALVDLARDNAADNDLGDRVTFIAGDIAHGARVGPDAFDHVMTNPPYQRAGCATPPGDASRAAAHQESVHVPLAAWVDFAFENVCEGGGITFIYTADRADELVTQMRRHATAIRVISVFPKSDRPASRVIVRAGRAERASRRGGDGLVLHETDGSYTCAAQMILRDGAALP